MGLHAMLRDLGFAAGLALGRPFDCLIQVTNRCNMKCSFCDFWRHGVPYAEELSTGEYRRLADDLAHVGRFLVSLEGGEPFLRPDLVEIVSAFARDHVPTLYTNGWFVTAENARALFDAGLVHASVSVDYATAERHDAQRALPGAFDRAWQAIDRLRAAAPGKGRQVHVITVLMADNWRESEALLQMSAAHGAGHLFTLLSTKGFRRGRGPERVPPPEAAPYLLKLWERYPHVQFLRRYFEVMGRFLSAGSMPACNAGAQSLNIDHVGNVSPCIERIDTVSGNVRQQPVAELLAALRSRTPEIARCQDCWTACRGLTQLMGGGGTLCNWWDLATRMRTA